MVDTNSDPRDVDYVIPSNDDASKSIDKILSHVSDAIIEGLSERKSDKDDQEKGEGKEEKSTKRTKRAPKAAKENLEAPSTEVVVEKQAKSVVAQDTTGEEE